MATWATLLKAAATKKKKNTKNCLNWLGLVFKAQFPKPILPLRQRGVIAQLGERLHGMQEVGGSIPPGSTIHSYDRYIFL